MRHGRIYDDRALEPAFPAAVLAGENMAHAGSTSHDFPAACAPEPFADAFMTFEFPFCHACLSKKLFTFWAPRS
jgi:hypothetical protein